jgi:hypothetical protein
MCRKNNLRRRNAAAEKRPKRGTRRTMAACDAHPFDTASNSCRRCKGSFCTSCLVYSFGKKKPPFCIPCALDFAGIRKSPLQMAR